MTSPTPSAHPSAIPRTNPQEEIQASRSQGSEETRTGEEIIAGVLPRPKLRLHVQDLRHPSSSTFLRLIPDVASTLETALSNIIRYLYTAPRPRSDHGHDRKTKRPAFTPSVPPTRSVTVFIRDFGGVAYTTGSELDNDHKEIHLSLSYIHSCTAGSSAKADPVHELVGVLTHELGIADFVRLKASLDPPHWKRPQSAPDRAPKWDMGYQHTAYFLAWVEDVRVGEGAIGMLNDRLLRVGYVGEDEDSACGSESFWKGLFGAGVAELWEEYGCYLDDPQKESAQRPSGDWEDEMVNPE
ncbi:hypothetical protein NUU61_006452 [Penicillium alfredii]|uniref:Uncharacterized protein n=1 Tax=Penicillium alfredii TaxID=1506179 RepID=A0A9W9F0X4_9EURO|nr:uncharacterized protein NUU61_006452 [Penicillium alfredii]KAJ5091582.1 hypothetical protein NUU61_006452 [Penicillium alfredii]